MSCSSQELLGIRSCSVEDFLDFRINSVEDPKGLPGPLEGNQGNLCDTHLLENNSDRVASLSV